jgi:hypothetical protein
MHVLQNRGYDGSLSATFPSMTGILLFSIRRLIFTQSSFKISFLNESSDHPDGVKMFC